MYMYYKRYVRKLKSSRLISELATTNRYLTMIMELLQDN